MKSKPAQAVIEKGTIVIRLPIKNLKMAVEGYCDSDWGMDPMVVTNSNILAEDVVRALNREEEDGSTPIHRLFDSSFEQALDDGSLGIELASRCEQCAAVVPEDKIIFDEDSHLMLCDKCVKENGYE